MKLAAIKDALDRGGLGAKTEIEITAKPYEQILDGIANIESGLRSEFRQSQGIEDDTPPALAESTRELHAADDDLVADAEQVDADDLSSIYDDDGQPDHTRRRRTRALRAHSGRNQPILWTGRRTVTSAGTRARRRRRAVRTIRSASGCGDDDA